MRIFLTGAAGFIGGEVAARLVDRGHSVTAGVHRNRSVRGNDGTPVEVVGFETIDLTRSGLGLSDCDAARIAMNHDLVIHCAATIRFDLAEADYRAINIDGTAWVLALAARNDLPMLYVSTAYVCGLRDGLILEREPLPTHGFANGYEASKVEAERLVAAASPRHVIARPSIVVGDSVTGLVRSFDAIYGAFKLIAEGRIRSMPARVDATLDLVPIDHVAGGLVALAERMRENAGRRFHLVADAPVPVNEWLSTIAAYPQFATPTLVDPAVFDAAALLPLERRFYERVAGLYAGYFQRAPTFDDADFKLATGLSCPPTDAEYRHKLIDYCIAAGFLAAAR